MDAPVSNCPSEEDLRLLCRGKASATVTEQFLLHLEYCPLCPDRADAIWAEYPTPPLPMAKPASPPTPAPSDPTPLQGTASGLQQMLDRADLERIGITFLPRSANSLCLGRLGEYDLQRVIGTGGMGIVFQASTGKGERPLALKTLKLGPATSLAARERFLREARALQAIRHPGLVPVLATGEEAGIPFFVMPLLTGINFERLIQREAPIPAEKVVDLARQAAEALAAAHAAGLVHRDIKPSNLWLEPPTPGHPHGTVRLLDFGLAQVEAEEATLTSTGVALGTPAYLSPEQAEGTGRIGPASDLFSLGCVLYEMLVGSRVFPGVTAMEIFRNIAAFRIVSPTRYRPSIPPRLEALLLRLLAHNPRQRPASADALLRELNHPDLLCQPVLTRRHLITTATAAGLGLAGFAAWRATRPKPLALFQPAAKHPIRDASAFTMVDSWDPDYPGYCVAWATPQGSIYRQALDGSPPELIGQTQSPVGKMAYGMNSLGVCSREGVARFLAFGDQKRVYWTAPPLDLPPIPEQLTDFVFNRAENRYLAAVGKTVRVWDTSGNQIDVYAPRCRATITSLIPCPATLDKNRAFAVTMQDGALGFLNQTNLLLYQEALMETPMDFRLAIRDDSVEAAVWDQSGHLAIWQAENFTHRSRKLPLRLPLDAEASAFTTPENPCQPLQVSYLLAGNNLLLMGELSGKRHIWVVDAKKGRVAGRLDVENPLEMRVFHLRVWVLDLNGQLLEFPMGDFVRA